MGRHSVPDDDAVDDAAEVTAALDLEERRGRHARSEAEAAAALDDRDTQMIAVIDPDVLPSDIHDTGEIVAPEPAILPLEEAPAEPSRADRRQEKKAAKAAAAAAKQAAKASAAEAKQAAKAAEAPAASIEAPAETPVEIAAAELAGEPAVAEPVGKAKKKRRTKKDGSETNTQADLRVLRENSAVRARCIAAVLVSFLLYTVVMVVIGRADAYLLWLWIPIVVSGFLVGFVLDLAHKAAKKSDKAPGRSS